jgi:hypothetical protein
MATQRASARSTSSAAGTVTFAVSGDTAEKEAYGKIVAAFNGRQSRVTVNLSISRARAITSSA